MFNIYFDTGFEGVTEADFPNFVVPFQLTHHAALKAIDFKSLTVTAVSRSALLLENATHALSFNTTNLEPTATLAQFQNALNNLLITGSVRTASVVVKPSNEILTIEFQPDSMTIKSGTQTVFLGGAIFTDIEDFVAGRDALLSLFGSPGSGPYSPGEALIYLDAMEINTIRVSDSTLSGAIIEIQSNSGSFRVTSHGYVLEAEGTNISLSNLAQIADALYNANVNSGFERGAFFDVHEFQSLKFTDPAGTVLFALDGTLMYDAFHAITPVLGTTAPETIGAVGATDAQYIYGGDGADTVQGGSGGDHLTGGAGGDTLYGGAGIDTAHFGQHLSMDGSAGVTVNVVAGTVTDSFGAVDQFTSIEQFKGSAFDDAFYGGNSGAFFEGLAGMDDLIGSSFADSLDGGDGHDRVVGKGGNDTLNGGDGADTINGGDGDDVIYGGTTNADLRDTVFAGAGNDTVEGGYGNDLIYGQDGNDLLAGGFGSDTLQGQGGDDTITGSALSDLVFGNDGNDFVNGGFGHDRINGGTGADKFYHLGIKNHGGDWVQDFSDVEGDVLVFGQAGATKDDFQVNYADSGSGDTSVDEAFIIYKPRAQLAGDNGIVWALVDGAGLTSLTIQTADGNSFDLLA